jgi:hypothetical protein
MYTVSYNVNGGTSATPQPEISTKRFSRWKIGKNNQGPSQSAILSQGLQIPAGAYGDIVIEALWDD